NNCGTALLAGPPASCTTINDTTTTVTCAASDDANTNACTFTVTVNDTEIPAITCPANITQNTTAGACTAVVSWTAPTASDNCALASVVCAPASGSTFNKGVATVTCTATDTSGNTNACTFTVTVTDSEPPVIAACPANIIKTNDLGQCSAVVTYTAPTATDNCGSVPVVCAPASGSTFIKGTTTVTCTASDGANTNACTFTVTVNDTEIPAITCPANITQ